MCDAVGAVLTDTNASISRPGTEPELLIGRMRQPLVGGENQPGWIDAQIMISMP